MDYCEPRDHHRIRVLDELVWLIQCGDQSLPKPYVPLSHEEYVKCPKCGVELKATGYVELVRKG